MESIDVSEFLSAADCASRTGLTVRALRVYEEFGLIAPRRSAGGWRQYGPHDLVKLNTIALRPKSLPKILRFGPSWSSRFARRREDAPASKIAPGDFVGKSCEKYGAEKKSAGAAEEILGCAAE